MPITPGYATDDVPNLTIGDVAELLNVSKQTVRRWQASGFLFAYDVSHEGTVGHRWRFKLSTVRSFIEGRGPGAAA